ncbi:MAG: IS1634 family transposase [Bdellovibrionota bacterium]
MCSIHYGMYLKEVIQKTKKGPKRRYLQFVESVRTEKGPRQNILVNLGRIDDKEGCQRLEVLTQALLQISQTIHILDPKNDLEGASAKQLGMELIFRRLFQQIGIEKILEKVFLDINTDFDVKDALFNLILNRLSNPVSKHAITDWQEDEFQVNPYDLHQYYRAMDYLHDNLKTLESEIFTTMKSLSNARKSEFSIALFDTTSVSYYGNGDEEESFLNYGFSKNRRSDLKQIVVGVAMTKDGIPISHETYSGNTNDISAFKKIIEKFASKHNQNNVTFVGDRGLVSQKNVKYLQESHYKYILGYKMRTINKEDRAALLKKANLKTIKKNLEYRDLEYKGQRIIVYYNAERAEKDKLKRNEVLDRIKDKLKNASIKSIVSNKDYKKYLKIEGETPTLDQQKINADSVFDGVFVLTTNTSITPSKAVETYRSLWQCEAGFRTLKSELDLQPLFHRKERRIRSHVFICFLALIAKNLLLKKIRAVDKEASYRKTILDLKRLQAMSLKIHNSHVTIRSEIGKDAKLAFRALQMAFPKKVLTYTNEDLIVIR